ncbi:MAG: PAS domain S-box protein [Desulfobacterota bacterium]|nr:PAS domain S-box protein [Thermodesulfobacteriota bacterium]
MTDTMNVGADTRPAQQALPENDDLYRRLTENSPDVLYHMSLPDGCYRYVSRAATTIFGYTPEEFYANPRLVEKLFHPDWLSYLQEHWKRLLQGDAPPTYEYQIIQKNGATRWINQRNTLIIGADGRPAAIEGIATDVTDRKQAEINLRDSEARYRALFEANPHPMWVYDLETLSFLAVNEAATTHYGFSREEFLAMTIAEIRPAEEVPRLLENVARVGDKGFDKTDIWKHRKKDGTLIEVEITSHYLEYQGREARLVLAYDVTERRRAEEQLRLVTENMVDAISRVDAQRLLVYCSPSVERLFGFTPRELMGRPAFEQVHPDDAERLLLTAREAIAARLPALQAEYRYAHGRGGYVWVESTIRLLYDAQGGFAGAILGSRDVTERKNAENALRQSEARYRALFEANPQPMWVYDLETLSFLAVNDAAVAHYGFSREEFLAMTIVNIRPEEDVPQLLEVLNRPGEQRVDHSGTWRHCKKDGSIIYVEITSHGLDYLGHPAKLVLANDVTERKKAAEEKEKLQEQLLQAQKMESVARLAGGVAHDFNNMLSAILGHTELALLQDPPLESIREDLLAIQNAAQRSATLTRQLLAFARKQTVAPRVLDLNDTVAGMLKMLLRLIGEDIDLIWMPARGLWPVKMDPSQIDQVLVNLCVNARDAITDVGKITIETENITIDEAYCALHPGFACGDYVLLAVSDNGCGMDKDVLDRLFEPFFTTKEVGKGTGLGLATVYGIVKQNEGFINVYSESDQGTTFRIYFPRFGGEIQETMLAGEAALPRGRGELVLLVEDEAAILHMGRAMLEGLGYTVLTAGTPGEALRLAQGRRTEIRLLITDVIMPEMNGRELAQMLDHLKPGLPCLFTSGYTANVIAHHGVLDEGVQFLQKPFSLKDLARKVRQILAEG